MVREEVARLQHESAQLGTLAELTLKLSGYTSDEQQLFRNVLFDQLYASLPRDPQAKVQIYNAEIAPGGYTNWHCHNGATFFIALQGIFEAEFQEGTLVKARAGDVYSEPIARFHRGHNPHPEVAYLCIGILGLKARDIVGYSMLQFVVHVPVVLFLVWILNYTLTYVPPVIP